MEITCLTAHAQLRMAQRNLKLSHIDYVLKYGRRSRGPTVTHYFLGRRDIPLKDRVDSDIARLEGTALVVDPSGQVLITVWRNRQCGASKIRHKRKLTLTRANG